MASEEGLYLKLFHGRKDPEEQPADWGFDGPVFGPFDWFHTTYSTHFRAGYDGDDSTIFEFELTSGTGDMLHYDTCWYGDWSVYLADQKPERWAEWDAEKAKLKPIALTDDPFNKLIEGTPDQMRLAASGICPICAQQAKICNLAFRVRSGEHTVQQCPDCHNVVIL